MCRAGRAVGWGGFPKPLSSWVRPLLRQRVGRLSLPLAFLGTPSPDETSFSEHVPREEFWRKNQGGNLLITAAYQAVSGVSAEVTACDANYAQV